MLERFELRAHHRVVHAGDVLLERQALEAHVAGDALANRRFSFAERFQAPMRVGIERAAERDEIGGAAAAPLRRPRDRRCGPATKTGIDTACLIGLAYGREQPRGNDGGWMQYFESCGLSLLPPERSSASTPARSSARASSTISSCV